MNKLSRMVNNSNVSRFRSIVQILFFILIMYGGYLAIEIDKVVPVFSCPYNKATVGTCYLISMQHQLHTTFLGLFSWMGLTFLTGLFTFILFFVVINKSWCGYICPLGTIQDWITKIRSAFGIRYSRYDKKSFKSLKWIKYLFLVLLIFIPLGMSNSLFGLPKFSHDIGAPFCQVCPGRTVLPLFNGDTSQIFISFSSITSIIMSSLGMILTGLFLVGSFYKKRFFCFLCPMSGLQYLFSRLGLLRLNKAGTLCTKCENCSRVCDIGIEAIAADLDHKFIVKDDCMMCFKCVEVCPEDECLKVRFIGLTIFKSTNEGFFKRYLGRRNLKITKEDGKTVLLNEKQSESE
ncbi:4Fe-4S binding protein [candidate division KSB1 bacterium]